MARITRQFRRNKFREFLKSKGYKRVNKCVRHFWHNRRLYRKNSIKLIRKLLRGKISGIHV